MPKARLSDIAIFENGDRSSNYPSGDEIKESGVLFLSTKNITNHQLDLTTRSFITESKFASLSRGKAQKGDLLITLRGTLGSSCIFDCEYETAFINAHMMIIRPKSDLRPQYLHALISSRQFQDLFNRIGQGAAVPQLTATQLGQLEIPVPTADLQLSFADKISATKNAKASQDYQLAELQNLFTSLQHRAFRGEL
jgi:type I restriction enzyme S subunit